MYNISVINLTGINTSQSVQSVLDPVTVAFSLVSSSPYKILLSGFGSIIRINWSYCKVNEGEDVNEVLFLLQDTRSTVSCYLDYYVQPTLSLVFHNLTENRQGIRTLQ